MKKSIFSRVAVLTHGRKYYLEYLRNMTPQVALFAFAILAGYKLNGAELNSKTYPLLLMLVSFMVLFAIAFYANSSTFYENCYGSFGEHIKKIREKLKSKGYSPFKLNMAICSSINRRKRVEFLEVIFLFWFLQLTLAAIITVAIFQAYGMQKLG